MATIDDDPELPTVGRRKSHEEEQSDTCCFRLIGRHDIREAGGSKWAPWQLHVLTRLCSCALLIALAVLAIPYNGKGVFWYFTYSLSTTTYILLAFSSVLFGVGTGVGRDLNFSTFVVFLHSFTASLSILFISDFAQNVTFDSLSGRRFNPLSLLLLLPLLVYLFDVLVMQARFRLRYRYALIVTSLFFVYTFVSGAVTRISMANRSSIGSFIGGGLLAVTLMFVSSIVAVSVTRVFNFRR